MARIPLLNVTDLWVSFHRGDQSSFEAVKGISFTLNQGETLALVGESGSGKSVTAASIPGLLPYPSAFHPKGSIQFNGQEILQCSEAEYIKIRGKEIGYIFQEPMTSLNPLHTVYQQIAEVFILHQGLTRIQAKEPVLDLLHQVGLGDKQFLDRYPHQLSGGQRQRIMIAIALACKPKLLIADEPTTALDVSIQREIMDLIVSLQQKHNMALLLISHDLNMVSHYAPNMIVMHKGKAVEQGLTQDILKNPTQQYTKKLIESKPSGKPAPLKTNQPILSVNNFNIAYDTKSFLFKKPSKPVVMDFSFDLHPGETIGIVGASGCGKSTLSYGIMRLLDRTASLKGKVLFQDVNLVELKGASLRSIRKNIQMVFQDPFSSLNPRFSVEQIITEGLHIHMPELTCEEIEKRVCNILKQVEMNPDDRFRYPHEFSGGQRQRIAIARALILEPKVIILDEPTSALDRSVQKEVLDLLRNLQKNKGLSYIFITHDLDVVSVMSHRLLVMEQGRIVEQGATEQILVSPQHPYTTKLLACQF